MFTTRELWRKKFKISLSATKQATNANIKSNQTSVILKNLLGESLAVDKKQCSIYKAKMLLLTYQQLTRKSIHVNIIGT